MARRQRINTFSLSFLDIMFCGFGATVLIFMIINHATEERSEGYNRQLRAEVARLEEQVMIGEANLTRLKNSMQLVDDETAEAQGLSLQLIRTVTEMREELADSDQSTLARRESLAKLKADIQALEEDTRRLEGSRGGDEDIGNAARTFVGEGDRQYVTGMRVGGKHILFLIDASASMLDETIVNVIRRRNMNEADKLAGPKWQRALATVDWLTSQVPADSQFQIYTFNTTPTAVIPGTASTWQDGADSGLLDDAMERLRTTVPFNGTSLINALSVVNTLDPMPDNIYLVTDGLPTQGRRPPLVNKVSADGRLKHFRRAVRELPRGIPVNVVLFPFEGDPQAAASYWNLVHITGGSFMSPARDWP